MPIDPIALAMMLPLVGLVGVVAAGRWPNVREAITLVTAVATFATVSSLVPDVVAGGRPEWVATSVLWGVDLAFRVEPLGMLFALVASGLWIVTSLYAIGYMRGHHETNQTRFFALFAAAIAAALAIAFSANLFTLFVFYELLTLSTYPLVTHHGTEKAMKGGRMYLGILLSTSVAFLLLAVTWTYALTGTLDFRAGGILAGHVSGPQVAVLLALFAFGTGKAALMPFHRWLPSAMVAPTPVSALLHAVAVVKAGVFTVLKVVIYVFGLDFLAAEGASTWLMVVASITVLTASIIALQQDNLKARLAYSTVSQLAYIVLGAALVTPAAATGAALHIAMHAMGKITLFFCAGALLVGAHKTKVSELDGIGRKMPWTMGAFFVGSLSIIGIPPFGGAWSKWLLGVGAVDAGHPVFAGVLMVSSLLSIGYLMPIVGRAFFLPAASDESPGLQEAPWLCVLPPCLTAVGCLVLFFWSDAVVGLIQPAVGG